MLYENILNVALLVIAFLSGILWLVSKHFSFIAKFRAPNVQENRSWLKQGNAVFTLALLGAIFVLVVRFFIM